MSILNNYITYLEYFLREKEDLIRALKDKLNMSEKKLTQSSSIVNKLMFGSQNLYEIISGTKYFDDK